MDISTALLLLAIGLIAGIAAGFVGIGGGMIIVPALVFGLGYDPTHGSGNLARYDASSHWDIGRHELRESRRNQHQLCALVGAHIYPWRLAG